MTNLKKIEQDNLRYADTIEELIAKPLTNEQLVSLCESVIRYLRLTGEELHEYNKKIEVFTEAMYRLP